MVHVRENAFNSYLFFLEIEIYTYRVSDSLVYLFI